MVLLTVLLLSLTILLFFGSLVDFAATPLAQRQAVGSVIDSDGRGGAARFRRVDRAFVQTRLGRWMERELVLAGIKQPAILVFLCGAGFTAVTATLLWEVFAPAFGLLGLLLGGLLLRGWLNRGKIRRREAFIAQMPELARVLANATQAGLSIATAIAIAGDEMEEPAREELKRVSNSLTFGRDIDAALTELRDRLPSREVAVLMTTLLVSARAGGSLVASLRTIAGTLDERKETRREIRSTLAGSVATGYMVIGMGFAMLLLLNMMEPGTVERMTQHPIGVAALVFAGVLFTAGFLIIRRMTRIDA